MHFNQDQYKVQTSRVLKIANSQDNSMPRVQATLQPQFTPSHTLLPGYCLPNIYLKANSNNTVNLKHYTKDQHLILFFIETLCSTQLLKKLHQLHSKYSATLHALNTRLMVCLSTTAINCINAQNNNHSIIIDEHNQLLYALKQTTTPSLNTKEPTHGNIIVIQKHSLIYNSFLLQNTGDIHIGSNIDIELRKLIEILKLLN
ncbi:hypothetical protein DA717_04940 [Piscirickettsiaceae bacterium NZ-RLO2]|nr:hypothetical protein DA717_04940 [Piscirickettsiaceae bacterium NZ-RLO2]